MSVSQIRRELGQRTLDIFSLFIPVQQGAYCEGMPEIMNPRSLPCIGLTQSGSPRPDDEGVAGIPMVKGAAVNTCEEARAGASRRADITLGCVAGKGFFRGGMQGHHAALSELGLSDRQNAGIKIQIVSLQQEGFRETQTG